MGRPRFDSLSGTIDGVNVVFQTPVPYIPHTVVLLLNGLTQAPDRLTETNPVTGAVTLTVAPISGDIVQAFYLDTSTTSDTEEIGTISGIIEESSDLVATLTDSIELSGRIEGIS